MKDNKTTFRVPDTYFDRLVECLATAHLSEIHKYAIDVSDIVIENIHDEAHSEVDETIYGHLENCLIALVRLHRSDYSNDDRFIQDTPEFLSVWKAALQIAEQSTYSSLPTDSNLRTLVDQMYERGIR